MDLSDKDIQEILSKEFGLKIVEGKPPKSNPKSKFKTTFCEMEDLFEEFSEDLHDPVNGFHSDSSSNNK